MEKVKTIYLSFNLNLSDIQENFEKYIEDKCIYHLVNNIYESFLIQNIIKYNILNDKKININGLISVKVNCTCNIIDPILNSVINVQINDVNKMGYSYKINKLCIFIPIHLCKEIYTINDNFKIKIIGKRTEENIVCIGQPI